MSNQLDQTLGAIEDKYAKKISGSSRHYIEVDIGAQARKMGFSGVARKYQKVLAVVPLKAPERGMKVRIDGRTFVNYGQLKSGMAIPNRVLINSKLTYGNYMPKDSMILNFT